MCEVSNGRIMSEQSNVESLSKNPVMKILYEKMRAFIQFFLFAPYQKSLIFMCLILFEEFRVRVFFFKAL